MPDRKKNIVSSVVILALALASLAAPAQETPIATAQLTVRGLGLQVEPAQQSVPVNTATVVKTLFSAGASSFPAGMVVRGRLTGPGLSEPLILTTLPNQPFAVPPFPVKGEYVLDDIRLEKDGVVLAKAVPEKALISVIDIVVTSVETRPLTLEEIREKGIVITQENFTVYNFSVGFIIESQQVKIEFPVIFQNHALVPVSAGPTGGIGGGGVGGSDKLPFMLEIDLPEDQKPSGGEGGSGLPPISGVIIFNNSIAFLNQFFSVMFIVSNQAPAGSPLTLRDVSATITLPEALREAQTNPPHLIGTPIPVRCPGPDGKLGTGDDVDLIFATFSGQGEFLVEGRRQGTHTVKVDFAATLSGLPMGDVPMKGTAAGAVTVRNPEFAVTFAHPSVVRKGEQYDIYVTLANTSKVTANLVSLDLPKTRQIGCKLLGEERHEFETIAPGEAQTARYHLMALQTGKVVATSFTAEGAVTGNIVLTAGVGEQGIPLSPDTLVLPGSAYRLPISFLEEAMLLLGEAYSIATTPAGSLPPHLPAVAKDTVVQRAVELAESGQRLFYGEDEVTACENVLFDWLGNRKADAAFDRLRRLTSKGLRLAQAGAAQMNRKLEAQALVSYQYYTAQANTWRSPYLSAALSAAGAGDSCTLQVADSLQNRLSSGPGEPVRQIPYGEVFTLAEFGGKSTTLALVGVFDSAGYTVSVQGVKPGSFDLALVVPDLAGRFRQVRFEGVPCTERSLARVEVRRELDTFILSLDSDGNGIPDGSVTGIVDSIPEPSLQLLAAVQDCDIHAPGHAVALMFNRPVEPASSKVLANYFIEGYNVYSAFPQPSGRVVVLGLDKTVSPFVENVLRVSGLLDLRGGSLDPDPTTIPIHTTIEVPGGLVSGKVTRANGSSVADAQVMLTEYEDNSDAITNSITRTDSSGNYQFDYARILETPFTITVKDPTTGKYERVTARVYVHGQRQAIDIVFRGRGTVQGVVLANDGLTPVAGAYVKIAAEGNTVVSSEWTRVLDPELFGVRCDAAGRFLVHDVPMGRVNVSASTGLAFGSVQTAVDAPDQVVETSVVIYATPRGTVQGRVLEADGITPVVGTSVYLKMTGSIYYSVQALTDEAGLFRFEEVPCGSVTVDAIDPQKGNFGASAGGTLNEGSPLELTLILRGTGSVQGHVQSAEGLPLSGIVVYLESTPFNTTSDGAGEFTLTEVPVGLYSVIAVDVSSNRQTSTQARIIDEGTDVRVLLTFPPNTAVGGISGRVLDRSGSPMPLTGVYLANGNADVIASKRTDASGAFSFTGIPPGQYTLASTKDTDGGVSTVSVLFPGHFAAADVRYLGTGTIRVRTLAPDGVTGLMAKVKLYYIYIKVDSGDGVGFMGDEMTVTSDSQGYATFSGVLAREFEVSAWNEFHPSAVRAKGTVAAGGETAVELKLAPTSNIHILVLSPDSTPGQEIPISTPRISLSFVPYGPTYPDVYGNESGAYDFTLVPAGNFVIRVIDEHDNYRGSINGTVQSGGTANIKLKLRGLGRVVGTVRRASGVAVPNAPLTLRMSNLESGDKLTTTADGNGGYVFYQVYEGKLSVEAKDSDPQSILGGRADGELVGNDSEARVDVTLQPAGTVSGRILTPDGLSPVSAAQVVLFRQSSYYPIGFCTSDSQGQYQFQYVPVEGLRVEVYHSATGRQAMARSRLAQEGQHLVLDIPLDCRGEVSGIFTDGSGMEPLAGATVTLTCGGDFPFNATATTDEAGHFRFSQVGEGNFTVEAVQEARAVRGKATGSITYEGQVVQLNVTGNGTGTVHGRVFRADGTTPVGSARLALQATGKYESGVSGADGSFTFTWVPLGSLSLKASEQAGRDSGSASGKLEFHGQELDLPVKMNGLGTVTGLVLDGGGGPVANATVTLYAQETGYLTIASGGDGRYTFASIPRGEFNLTAKSLSGLGASAKGQVTTDGETVAIDLTLASAGIVSGTLLQADGSTPASNALVRLTSATQTLYASSDAGGAFSFPVVKVDAYALNAEGLGNSGRYRQPVVVSAHGQEVTITGAVLDNLIPTVTSLFPPAGAQDVPASSPIVIAFSEPMDKASLAGSIRLSTGASTISGTTTPSADGRSLTFTPTAPFASLSLYTFTLSAKVEDAAGNPIAAAITSTFISHDSVPPAVTAIDPAASSISVPVDGAIRATFSEPVDPASVNASSFTLTKQGGAAVPGTLTLAENHASATFIPSALEVNATYTVRIVGLADTAGNIQTAAFTSSFSTTDTIPPDFTLMPPGEGTTLVEGTYHYVQAINASSDVARIQYSIDGAFVKSLYYPPYAFEFTVPSFAAGKSTFLIEAVAVDRAGNQSETKSLTLTIRADQPPSVRIEGPSNATVLPGQDLLWYVYVSDDVYVKSARLRILGGNVDASFLRSGPFNNLGLAFSWKVPGTVTPGVTLSIGAEAIDSTDKSMTATPLQIQTASESNPPTVSLTSPADGSRWKFKQVIPITASAGDDFGVREVRFYVNGQLLATDAAAPYQASFTVPAYKEDTPLVIRAQAEDYSGKTADAQVTALAELIVDPNPPTVSITSPANHSLVFAGEALKIKALATDDKGVARVEFRVNGELLSTDEAAPFEATYTVPSGLPEDTAIQIAARAVDVNDNDATAEVAVETISGTELAAGTTIGELDTSHDGETIIIRSGTVTIDGSHSFANVLVKESGRLTHSPATTTEVHRLQLRVTGRVCIGPDAAIDATAKGYLGGNQPGNAGARGRTLGNVLGSYYTHGGNHAGYGGLSDANSKTPGEAYGSYANPTDHGAGGGQGYGTLGGNGGGVVTIAADQLLVDGRLSAEGQSTDISGAGGSIRLDLRLLAGSGSISTSGGSGSRAGGGGRLALYTTDSSAFTGTLSAAGGTGATPTDGVYNGGPGTIYTRTSNGQEELKIDNNNLPNHKPWLCPLIPPATYEMVTASSLTDNEATFLPDSLKGLELIPDVANPSRTFTITGNDATTLMTDPADGDLSTAVDPARKLFAAKFFFPGHLRINRTSLVMPMALQAIRLTLENNGFLVGAPSTLTYVSKMLINLSGKLAIDASSKLDANSLGYLGGWQGANTAIEGRTLGNLPGSGLSNGGSHGGLGGRHNDGQALAAAYGSAFDPIEAGGGGAAAGTAANVAGSSGGGILFITADEVENQGSIQASGNESRYGAGGAGGSIQLHLRKIAGTGLVEAIGGNSTYSVHGAGGGGRVAVYYQEAEGAVLSGVHSFGGIGNTTNAKFNGASGTVYLKQAGAAGQIVVSGRGSAAENTARLIRPGPGTISQIQAHWLRDDSAAFVPGSLVGMLLAPKPSAGQLFTIKSNTEQEIFTLDTESDMTLVAAAGDPYEVRHPAGLALEGTRMEMSGAWRLPSLSMSNATLTFDGILDVDEDASLQSQSLITHSPATISSTSSLDLRVGGRLAVDSSSRIDATGLGYLGGRRGDNTSTYGYTLGNQPFNTMGNSGGHGGLGGIYYATGTSNRAYGSIDHPDLPGSGAGSGGSTTGRTGGNGGGVIAITAGELTLDGKILANGDAGANGGGSGAGGSIQVEAGILSGTGAGEIRADGYGNSNSGGGGGRVALRYGSISGFDLSKVTALGGKYSTGTDKVLNGAVGTVYLHQTGQTPRLRIASQGTDSNRARIFITTPASTVTSVEGSRVIDAAASFVPNALAGGKVFITLAAGEQPFAVTANDATSLTLDPTPPAEAAGRPYRYVPCFEGILEVINTRTEVAGQAEVSSLLLSQGSILTHPGATITSTSNIDLKVSGKAEIDASSTIDATAKGFLGGYQGDNANTRGRTLGNALGSSTDGSGSHAGLGGKYAGNTVNDAYGSLYLPTDLGSGSGGYSIGQKGGSGGGAIRLEADELVLNGSIWANGENGSYASGAGGSVLLKVRLFSGSGTVRAVGGTNTSRTGGGGGRIALYFDDPSLFTGTILAAGGKGGSNGTIPAYNGGAGTVFTKQAAQERGSLTIDNDGIATSGYTTILPAVGRGYSTALGADFLENGAAAWKPGSLRGLHLNPYASRDVTFPILSNDATRILCDVGADLLTNHAASGDEYVGEHLLFNLTITGKARVSTLDRIRVSGTQSVSADSVLQSDTN